jgi:protein SCO1
MIRLVALLLFTLIASVPPLPAGRAEAAPIVAGSAEDALKRSRAVEGNSLTGEYHLLDQEGRPVDLASFRGRPLLISLIYTSCDHTCPVMTQTVMRAVTAAKKALGDQSFQVVSIGFDTVHDTPSALKYFARQQGVSLDNWTFLSADADTIERLSAELGFTWFVSSRGFDHIAQTSVIDSEGKIYRQVYGENFELPLLVEPLKDLVLGRTAALTSLSAISDRVRFFCTVYDPGADAYRFDYGVLLDLGFGFLAVITIAWVLLRLWRDTRAA